MNSGCEIGHYGSGCRCCEGCQECDVINGTCGTYKFTCILRNFCPLYIYYYRNSPLNICNIFSSIGKVLAQYEQLFNAIQSTVFNIFLFQNIPETNNIDYWEKLMNQHKVYNL